MTGSATHIIARQKVAMRYRGVMRVEGLQNSLRESFEVRLPARLSAVFDRIAGPEEWLHIDKLDVQVSMEESAFEPDVLSRIIAERIEQAIRARAAVSQNVSSLNEGRAGNWLQRYLLDGFLPWWAAGQEHLPSETLSKWIAEKRWAEVRILLQSIVHQPPAAERLLVHLPPDALETLLVVAFGWTRSDAKHLLDDAKMLRALMIDAVSEQYFVKTWHRLLLSQAVVGNRVTRAFARLLAQTFYVEHPTILSPQIFEGIQTRLLAEALEENGLHEALPKEQTVPNTPTNKDSVQIQTDTAGLCILAPFLPQLFATLGVTNAEQKLQDPPKAIALLRALSGKSDLLHEGELVLEKILCDIALYECVMPLPQLEERDITEAKALLEAVISHWSALKNTSPDGLREGFLRRAGMLSSKGENWTLKVQAQAQDILLDRLLWNYKMIRTHWMKNILFVEW